MSDNVEQQLELLERMPLSATEYSLLRSCRNSLMLNTLGLGFAAMVGGRVMNKPTATPLTALGFSAVFGLVGGLIGLGLGVQFCVYRLLDQKDSPLSTELAKLRTLVQKSKLNKHESF